MKVTLEQEDGKEQIVVTVRENADGTEYAYIGGLEFSKVDYLTWEDGNYEFWFEIENEEES